MVSIISITKDDLPGIERTVSGTARLREELGVQQIIVDSSTGTVAGQVRELAAGESNLEYIWQKPSGISNAFNAGLAAAKHDWIWFLNGGDSVHPEFPFTLFSELIHRSSADFLIFQIQYAGSKAVPAFPPVWLKWPPFSSWIPHPAALTRRSVFEKFGNFDPRFRLVMDYDFWLRSFSQDTKADFISVPVALFDETGVSTVLQKQVSREVLKSTFYRSGTLLKSFLVKRKLQGQTLLRLIRKSLW